MLFSFLIPNLLRSSFKKTIKKRFGFKDDTEYYDLFLEQRKISDSIIPKYDLESKHIKNLKVLTDRLEMLKLLPQSSICAEIGVDEGEFSDRILKIVNPVKLHLIDAWGDADRYHDGLKLKVKDRFRKEIETGKVEINVGLSVNALEKFPDNYFDWVYLDTAHTYEVTAAELNILKNKVKAEGIIAGHDYI